MLQIKPYLRTEDDIAALTGIVTSLDVGDLRITLPRCLHALGVIYLFYLEISLRVTLQGRLIPKEHLLLVVTQPIKCSAGIQLLPNGCLPEAFSNNDVFVSSSWRGLI